MMLRLCVSRLAVRSRLCLRLVGGFASDYVAVRETMMKDFIRVSTDVQEKDVSSLEEISFAREKDTSPESLVIANLQTSIIPEVTAEELESQRCVWRKDKGTILQALILPSDMAWPTFHDEGDEKSSHSAGKHILFRRVAQHSVKREDLTEQTIGNKYSVVYVGIPGIGKTLALNYVLLRCLHSWVPKKKKETSLRGYANFPYRRVIFRLSSGFYVITNTTKEGDDRLSTDVKYVVSKNLDDVDDECINHGYTRKDTLLLLELQETEHEVGILPIMLVGTISSRGADQAFKHQYKGNGQFYLMDPWSYPECLAMGRVLDAAAGRQAEESGSITQQMKAKFAYAGGVPRTLLDFRTAESLRAQLEGNVSNFFSAIEDITAYNVPSAWQDYVAPFVCNYETIDGAPANRRDFTFEFLTNTTRQIIFSKVESAEEMRILAAHRLTYQNHQ